MRTVRVLTAILASSLPVFWADHAIERGDVRRLRELAMRIDRRALLDQEGGRPGLLVAVVAAASCHRRQQRAHGEGSLYFHACHLPCSSKVPNPV